MGKVTDRLWESGDFAATSPSLATPRTIRI